MLHNTKFEPTGRGGMLSSAVRSSTGCACSRISRNRPFDSPPAWLMYVSRYPVPIFPFPAPLPRKVEIAGTWYGPTEDERVWGRSNTRQTRWYRTAPDTRVGTFIHPPN
jgi:hypothetical protein